MKWLRYSILLLGAIALLVIGVESCKNTPGTRDGSQEQSGAHSGSSNGSQNQDGAQDQTGSQGQAGAQVQSGSPGQAGAQDNAGTQGQSGKQAETVSGAPQPSGPFIFKAKLSEYGFYKGAMRRLDPEAGVVSYSLHTPLFSDYAVKDRFIVLPKGKSMRYTETGVLDFPDSTYILKNFSYIDSLRQQQRIETRILFKDPYDHGWKVMDYVWNTEQTDAEKTIIGAAIPLALRDDQGQLHHTVYKVPNTNDCKRCHNNNNVFMPIGPKARNLNFTASGQQENQLARWAAEGLLTGMPAIQQVPVLPDWKDAKHYALPNRARAYLDVNCAHCHTKGGDAYNTGLFLEYEQTDPFRLGVGKEPVSAGNGAGGLNFDIVPGHIEQSILAYRMNSAEPGTAMPELGRSLIHREGVALINAWIRQLKKEKK